MLAKYASKSVLLFSQNTWKKNAENINYSKISLQRYSYVHPFECTDVHPFECTDVTMYYLISRKKNIKFVSSNLKLKNPSHFIY